MLSDFQQALAEITASPRFCQEVRRNASLLRERYQLSERERRQVLAMAQHPAMECACSLYRANRLAPLFRNLPRTLEALRDRLEATLNDYWQAHPWPYRYGYLESERFCHWLEPFATACHAPAELAQSWQAERRALRGRVSHVLADSGIPVPQDLLVC